MRPKALLLALSLLTLSGCSTLPPRATPTPPPVQFITKCAAPQDLPEGPTAQDLADWVMGWIGTAGCERAKREGLVEAWPR